MIRPGSSVNSPATTQRAGEDRDHRAAMVATRGACARATRASGSIDQREDRQQMDRAPRTDQPDLMDPERADRHGQPSAAPRSSRASDAAAFPSARRLHQRRARRRSSPRRHEAGSRERHSSSGAGSCDVPSFNRASTGHRTLTRLRTPISAIHRAVAVSAAMPATALVASERNIVVHVAVAAPPAATARRGAARWTDRRSRNRRRTHRSRNCRRRRRCGRRAWSASS